LRDALPNASYIGFTGTPIEKEDKSTPAVFGGYIDIYDIKQSVDDRASKWSTISLATSFNLSG
jgi:type I restriction enzyme R subunit